MQSGLDYSPSSQPFQLRNRFLIDTEEKFLNHVEDEESRTGDSETSIPSSPREIQKEPVQFLEELEHLAGILIAIKTDSVPALKKRFSADIQKNQEGLSSDLIIPEESLIPPVIDEKDPSYSQDEIDSDEAMPFGGTSDEEFLEEDDEEWIEQSRQRSTHSRSPSLNTSQTNVSTDPSWRSPSSSQRTPRKKAPSGTACERHKRWKKKCPNDCPWKTTQGKAILENLGITQQTNGNNSVELSSDEPQHEEDDEELLSSDEPLTLSNGTSSRPSKKRSSDDNDEDSYRPVSARRSPPITNTNTNNSTSVQMKTTSSSNKVTSPTTSASSRGGKRGTQQTVACEHHTILHARCPPDCPERRPAKPHPRNKRARIHNAAGTLGAATNGKDEDLDDSHSYTIDDYEEEEENYS